MLPPGAIPKVGQDYEPKRSTILFSRHLSGHRQCCARMPVPSLSARRIWNSAVFWTWIYNGVRLASGVLLLLPLLNRYLSKEDFGMYWHFIYMVALVPLLDATFSVT